MGGYESVREKLNEEARQRAALRRQRVRAFFAKLAAWFGQGDPASRGSSVVELTNQQRSNPPLH